MARYKMDCDWHTHTVFSHGKGRIEDNVNAGRLRGLKTIGIADHGPGHVLYGIKRRDIAVMRHEIDRLRLVYPDIEILLGVEANIINRSGRLDLLPEEFAQFDYVLAGYHYGVFGENPVRAMAGASVNYYCDRWGRSSRRRKHENTELIVKAVCENDIFMLTHPGDKGPVDIRTIAAACEERNTIFEINTLHNSLSEDALREAASTGVKFAISSDAHTPGRVGVFEGAVELAVKAGIDPERIVNLSLAEME